jgi:hypothetical protein
MGELKQGSSLDSKTEQELEKKRRGTLAARVSPDSIPYTERRLLDLEAIKTPDANGASPPEQAHGPGCTRDC